MKRNFYKLIIFIFFKIVLVIPAYSQFIINSNHNPVVGDTLNFVGVDTTGVLPGPDGANQIWNFSNLSIFSEILFERFVLPSATPFFGSFPNSNIASVSNETSPVYNYHQISNSDWRVNGYVGPGYMHIFYNPVTSMHYPISYGSQDSSQWAGVFTSGNIINKSSGSRTSTCDGYGTLLLPSGSHYVMRVKTTESRIDTGRIGDSLLWIRHENSTTYDWYKEGFKFSIFQIGLWNFNEPPYNSKTVYLRTRNAPVGIKIISDKIPDKNKLYQNYPNPFNPNTVIKFQILDYKWVTLKVFDILGKEVATLVNEKLGAGEYEIPFTMNKLSNGIYFYRLETDKFIDTKKMILLK